MANADEIMYYRRECHIFRWYPAKRALPTMLTHGRSDPFDRMPSIYHLLYVIDAGDTQWAMTPAYTILA